MNIIVNKKNIFIVLNYEYFRVVLYPRTNKYIIIITTIADG